MKSLWPAVMPLVGSKSKRKSELKVISPSTIDWSVMMPSALRLAVVEPSRTLLKSPPSSRIGLSVSMPNPTPPSEPV